MSYLTKAIAPQLYLLTNDDEFELLYQKLETTLATGLIGLIQIRRKKTLALPNGSAQLFEEARRVVELAQSHNVPVVMNDNVDVAVQLGIGVHLGQQDGCATDARRFLGSAQIVGRTCHGSAALVEKAKSDGASYAAMGAIFASTTKPKAETISRQQLEAGCQKDIDICVIGGLTAENISNLKGLPIKYVAVVGDIMDLPVNQIAKRCQQWQQALSKWYTPA
ncbi:thiamine phosphate synthase [Psychrobacter sp.]|uniref:thiamine phosphate synthase n=1 Tax=Psychrobacter sp. TaxID=56811 RepID=UPI003F9E4B47